ncbi:MAG TPA: alpha/beta fold hydrolase [Polyangiaceae bacterium]
MYVSTRLGRWFYEERGHARHDGDPTVVLWHSFLCDGGMWDAQVGPLSELGRVIVFDGPGHGKSEAPPVFTLEDNARALGDALDALGVDRVIVVGLSWGGMMGIQLALLDPKRVVALALIDTSASPEVVGKQLKYRAMLSTFRRVGLPPFLVESQVAKAMFSPRTLRSRRELVERFAQDLAGFSREGVYRVGRAIFWRVDIVPRLGSIKARTLVMHGTEDAAIGVERAHIMADRIPGARLVMIEGAGHLSALEEPEAMNAALVPFVREAMG